MNEEQSISIAEVYEVIGRLYLQTWTLKKNNDVLSSQLSELSERHNTLQKLYSERVLMVKPVSEALKELKDKGVKVTEANQDAVETK